MIGSVTFAATLLPPSKRSTCLHAFALRFTPHPFFSPTSRLRKRPSLMTHNDDVISFVYLRSWPVWVGLGRPINLCVESRVSAT